MAPKAINENLQVTKEFIMNKKTPLRANYEEKRVVNQYNFNSIDTNTIYLQQYKKIKGIKSQK
ncbi:MAG: hypothetical protein CMI31_00050 [Opitutae bacterium]|nr:hypothetical protein [Opitutae bacterium]